MESNLFEFVRCLSKAEYSVQGSSLSLSIKYKSGNDLIIGSVPPRGDYLTSAGLKDPGFGSGPTEFSEISYIIVHAKSIRFGELPSYTERYELLKELIKDMPGVEIQGDFIVVTNIDVR